MIASHRASALDLLGKLIMPDFEPLNPAGGRNPRKAAIPEEKYIFVHINSGWDCSEVLI